MTPTMTRVDEPAKRRAIPAPASLVRLTTVELRKMYDTRAGRWLLIAIGLAALARQVLGLFVGEADDRTFHMIFASSMLPVSLLLPVVGILAITSEWGQRTAQVTFTLTPHRFRVVLAKLAAAIALTGGVVAACLAAAAVVNLFGIAMVDANGSWHLTATIIPNELLYLLICVLSGMGLGMLLLNSAAAIVLYYVLPSVWTLVTNLVESTREAAKWLDLTLTSVPLIQDDMSSGAWARLGTSALLWSVLPITLGAWRLLRSEIK
jgi:ABC-type transport system involved in multi-copper enzyme maturation permease subunit